ncbi:MAG: lamin tail domain-containing protein [Anaerolineae bacterium]|nr:lamin tail domain-containing protein [Anaerolineae bacterium]
MVKRYAIQFLGLCFLLWAGVDMNAAASQPPPPLPLLITEVYYDTPGRDEDEEWIEIANIGLQILDLSDIKIGDATSSGGNEGMVRFPEGSTIAPGQAIVIAQTARGFHALFSHNPDYEIRDTNPDVPDMRPYRLWATGSLALANGGDEVVLLNQANVINDGVNYGNKTTLFEPAVLGVFTGQSIERVPANCDTNTAADWQPQRVPTPGILQFDGVCTTPEETRNLLAIGQIQGNGPVAARVNEIVTFRAVVTGVYRDRNSSGQTYYTLFVQDIPGSEDGDPATSDGIALFLGRQSPRTQIGDHVLITGLVTEFFGFTELDDDGLEIMVESQGNPLPIAIEVNPPADNAAAAVYYEPYEAMRVSLPTSRVVGPTIQVCSFAVVRLDSGLTRVIRHQISDPIGQIIPVLHTNDTNCTGFPQVKTGDQVAGLVGPLIYHFDQFKIVQQDAAALTLTRAPAQPAPVAPPLQSHQISFASFNVENHFDNLDDTGDDAEPKPLPIEIRLKQSKLAYAIHTTLGCPTVIGIQEIEKANLLLDLANEVAQTCGFTYAVSHRESPDVRGIDLALLTDPRIVQVQAVQLRQTCSSVPTGISDSSITCLGGEQPLFSRPPLQVNLLIQEQPVTVLVNHFKSKRGGEAETEKERLAQAAYVNQLGQEFLSNGQAHIVIMGDFNDYFLSPPLQKLAETGFSNALATVPEGERYSFVFSGASQLIDGIFLSPALAEHLAQATILHVNADYPDILGGDVSVTGLPYQATDHDLPLVILNWGAEPEIDEAAAATSFPWIWLLGGTVGLGLLITWRRTRPRTP